MKLPAPFSRRIAEPFDADAAGQATLHRCLDKIRCEEGERDGHVGLPNAAFLASAKLCDRRYSTRDNVIQPPTTSRDGAVRPREIHPRAHGRQKSVRGIFP